MDKIIYFPFIVAGEGLKAFQDGVENARSGAGVGVGKGVGAFIGVIVQAVLQLVGVIFLVLIIYGGFRWMTASGQEKQLREAEKIITHSIVGLMIVIAAYAISTFVVAELQKTIT